MELDNHPPPNSSLVPRPIDNKQGPDDHEPVSGKQKAAHSSEPINRKQKAAHSSEAISRKQKAAHSSEAISRKQKAAHSSEAISRKQKAAHSSPDVSIRNRLQVIFSILQLLTCRGHWYTVTWTMVLETREKLFPM